MNHGIEKFSRHSSKKAKTKVNACMVKATAKRSRELGRFLFCLGFFPLKKAKPQPLYPVGQGGQKESWHSFPRLAYHQNIMGNNISQRHRGWRTCSVFPFKAWKRRAPARSRLFWTSAEPGQERTPSPPRSSSSTFLLHALLSQALLQAHLLLLINKSSLHKLTLIEARLRLRTAGLSLWVCLYIQHLFFHCLSSLHYVHWPRLCPSSKTAGTTPRQSLFCSGTRFASWACKQETQPQILRISKYARPG